MSKKESAESNIPKEVTDAYSNLAESFPGIEIKGKTMPYTSLNGNMFSFITSEGGLAVRLSKEARAEFLATHENSELNQHGAVMKEYVAVPADILNDADRLKPLFARSYEYAQTLKPKAVKKK